MVEESEPVRIRVCFEDGHLLSAQHRKEGLWRCWLLLPPTVATVADLSDHLCRRFNLQNSCPHGLILSMDGFVLPSFESTDIIQDKDIISVRKKGVARKDISDVHDDEHGVELVDKSTLNGVKLLAIKELQEESGGYMSGDENDSFAAQDDALPAKPPLKEVAKTKRRREQSTDSDNSRRKKQKCIKDLKQKAKQNTEKSNTCEKILSKDKSLSECTQPVPNDTRTAGKDDGIPISGGNEKGKKHAKDKKVKQKAKQNNQTGDTCEKVLSKDKSHSGCTQPGPNDTRTAGNDDGIPMSGGNEERKKKQKRVKDKKVKQKAMQNTRRSDAREKILSKDKSHSVCTQRGPNDTQTAGNDGGIPMSGGSEEGEIPNDGNLQRVASNCPSATSKKVQSRSARRKKAKRQWLRELKRLELLEHAQWRSPEKDSHGDLLDLGEGDQNNDHAEEELSSAARTKQHDANNDDKVIPVLVRPGHIRFEPIEDHSIQNSEQHAELLQWYGTTSKKKGQKWGREKFLSRTNDDFVSNDFVPNCNIYTEEAAPNGTNFPKDSELANGHVDYEKLVSFTSQPKEGDVIAYRLVELSSSWCPELSPFRVGRVSSYDAASTKVVLLPVDEFPVFPEANNGEENLSCQQSVSLYNDDGSLVIDFASLIDVRQFKLKDPEPVTSGTPEKFITSKGASQKEKEADAQTEGSRDAVWEQLRSALEEKKAQLSTSNAITAKRNQSDRSSSYRAIRASALGPTLALLRAQNNL